MDPKDIDVLDLQVNASIQKIDYYVKNPAGTAPLDDELNTLMVKLNSVTNQIHDPQQMAEHTARVQRLHEKVRQYDIARKSIQSQTRTDLIGVAAGQKEIKDASEKIVDLDMKNIETFLRLSNLIIDRFSGPDRITLQSIRGSLLLSNISTVGFVYRFTPKGLELHATDPARAQKATETMLAINTLISAKVLTLDELKQGLLYTTPSFGAYAEGSRLSDGTPNTGAKMQDYVAFLQKKPPAELTREEKTVLESQNALNTVKMPELIRSYQNLGQVGNVLANNPAVAAQAQAVIQTTDGEVAPNNPIQNGANATVGKTGEFAGAVAGNIGGFAKGVTQALGEGFKQGGAIGGLAVAVIGIMGAWKFLTGNWGPEKHKVSGWMIALGAFGGKAAWDMMEKYGLIDKAKDGADVATDAAKKAKEAAQEAARKAGVTTNPDTTPTNVPTLTPSQQKGVQALNSQKSVIETAITMRQKTDARINGTFQNYIDYVHSQDLQNLKLSSLIFNTDNKISIFTESKANDFSNRPANLDPAILKRVMRAYLGISDPTGAPNTPEWGKKEKEDFIKKSGIDEATWKDKTLSELVTKIYT